MRYDYNGYRPSFKERLMRFFSGRNGTDAICYALFAAYLLVAVLNLFISSFILWCLGWCIIAYLWFRVFSRNIYKRRAENERFISLILRVKRYFKIRRRAFSERKLYSYKKCIHCKSTLRLPKKKGKHTVKCPRCGKEFYVKI